MLTEYTFLRNPNIDEIENLFLKDWNEVLFYIDLLRNAHKLRLQEQAVCDYHLSSAIISFLNYDKKNKEQYKLHNMFGYAFDKGDIAEIEQEELRQKVMNYMMKGGK